jgi:hypothetical protein
MIYDVIIRVKVEADNMDNAAYKIADFTWAMPEHTVNICGEHEATSIDLLDKYKNKV